MTEDTAGGTRVRVATTDDADFVHATLTASWGEALTVAGHGHLHDLTDLPTFVAIDADGQPVGVLTIHDDADATEREVVTIDAVRQGEGIGHALLRAIERTARQDGVRRLWLTTTNDNTIALRAYQRAGWDLVALHRGAVDAARALKPSIPQTGLDDIPMRHELEMEKRLDSGVPTGEEQP